MRCSRPTAGVVKQRPYNGEAGSAIPPYIRAVEGNALHLQTRPAGTRALQRTRASSSPSASLRAGDAPTIADVEIGDHLLQGEVVDFDFFDGPLQQGRDLKLET